MGSTLELKRMLNATAYKKVKANYAKKDWEIVAMTPAYLVLRIEHENIQFNRQTGAIQHRVALGKRKPQ